MSQFWLAMFAWLLKRWLRSSSTRVDHSLKAKWYYLKENDTCFNFQETTHHVEIPTERTCLVTMRILLRTGRFWGNAERLVGSLDVAAAQCDYNGRQGEQHGHQLVAADTAEVSERRQNHALNGRQARPRVRVLRPDQKHNDGLLGEAGHLRSVPYRRDRCLLDRRLLWCTGKFALFPPTVLSHLTYFFFCPDYISCRNFTCCTGRWPSPINPKAHELAEQILTQCHLFHWIRAVFSPWFVSSASLVSGISAQDFSSNTCLVWGTDVPLQIK